MLELQSKKRHPIKKTLQSHKIALYPFLLVFLKMNAIVAFALVELNWEKLSKPLLWSWLFSLKTTLNFFSKAFRVWCRTFFRETRFRSAMFPMTSWRFLRSDFFSFVIPSSSWYWRTTKLWTWHLNNYIEMKNILILEFERDTCVLGKWSDPFQVSF